MSRIGKKPIGLPEKVEVKINKLNVSVKGQKGRCHTHSTRLFQLNWKARFCRYFP